MTVDMSSSKSNIEQIKAQFNQVIEYSQNFTVNSDILFEEWFEAKRDFIENWHGQLILEIPYKVCFELSQKDKDSRLDDFINTVANTFDNEYLAQFIEDNRKGFFQNRVVLPWANKYIGVDVPEGMKLLKAFKYFEDDPITLKDLQTQASMIIQEDKVEGTLCFSVHPLDFLSSSENTYKWRSCHALDGEYRAGNLSYMVDSSTIMCYLRGADEAKLPNFPPEVPWNSKKWRMLLFFSDNWDVLFAGRQYPFFSHSALEIVMQHLSANQMCNGRWSKWHNDQITSFDYEEYKSAYDGGSLMWPYICISNEIMKLFDIVHDNQGSMHFNDLLRSSCYKPYYCFKYYRRVGEVPKVNIGGNTMCLHCGKAPIVAADTMLCEDCELDFGESSDDRFGYCDYCDRRIVLDEGHYIPSHGQVVCEWCYEQHVKQCSKCNNDFFYDDIIYDKPSHSYMCQHCIDNRRRRYSCSVSSTDGNYYHYRQEYTDNEPAINQAALQELIEKICHSEDY